MPSARNASATSSWVESGLAAARTTRAPPACSARIRFAVSAVTCRHAAIAMPSNGRSRARRSRIERRTGICPSAHSIRAWPGVLLVAIVIRLVRTLDRDADVGGLVVGQLRQLRADGVEVQTLDLLVEMLGEH